MGGLGAALADLPGLVEQPVHRGDRGQVHALIDEQGPDLPRGLVGEPRAVQDSEQLVVCEAQPALEGGGSQNNWFSPPNTSLTESSVKMRRIESVSRSEQLSTRMVSGAPGRSGIVSVTTICSKSELARFS